MLVRLDMESDEAIYDQIAASIGAQIAEGLIEPGDKLPAARRLAESLDVNVHTVLKGYATLEQRGLVEIRRGRGGVVVNEPFDMEEMVRRLVDRARTVGLGESELQKMIEESW